MAGQDPLKPKNDGRIKLPSVTAGQNKKRPRATKPADDTKGSIMLGADDPPPEKPKRKRKREPKYSAKAGDDERLDDDEEEREEKPDDDKDEGNAEDEELLDRALKRFKLCADDEGDNRQAAVSDRKFRRGRPEDQWPADVLATRLGQKRPAITVSKIATFCLQVTNDLRQNRPSIGFSPIGSHADKNAAKIFKGLVRSIERDCHADIAYDTAVEDAVTSGFGFFRTVTEYEGEDSFDQVIKVRRIRNPFSVYLDKEHKEPDGSDATYAFITEMIHKDEYKDKYDDDPSNWNLQGIGDNYKEWSDKDNVRIAEYFEFKTEERRLVELANGHIGYWDDLDEDLKGFLTDNPDDILEDRDAECHTLMWYKMSAVKILERQEWPGKFIPIVKVIGSEIDVEGKVEYQGVVRHIKGAQQMRNYWRTKQTESIANAPNTPWIMEEGQLEGHEDEWRAQNLAPKAVLTYKGTSVSGAPAPPPQRVAFAEIPAGFVNAVEGADQDMMGASGIRFDATKNERLNDESGVAIKELRRSTDLGSLHYGDNLGRSLKFQGHIYLDLIPKTYTRRQVVQILREDDKEQSITIDPNAAQAYQEKKRQDGTTEIIFNPKIGKYGIAVVLGPSYATKRIESADRMLELTKALPQQMAMAADIIVKNFDFEDADELSRRLAMTLPPGMLQPEMKDVPGQVQALLGQQQQHIKQLTQLLQKAGKEIADKGADRAVAQDKIDKDFEAKLLGIMQKAEGEFQGRIQEQLSMIVDAIGARTQPQPRPNGQDNAPPQG